MPERNYITWTTMIQTLAFHQRPQEAVNLFRQMELENSVQPHENTWKFAIAACTSIATGGGREGEGRKKGLEEGRYIHQQAIRKGVATKEPIAVALIKMFARCGSIEDARLVFEATGLNLSSSSSLHTKQKKEKRARLDADEQDLWSTMQYEYAALNRLEEVVALFERMQRQGIEPNKFTLSLVLTACADMGTCLQQGRQAHSVIVRNHMLQEAAEDAVLLGNALINMYR